MDEIGVALSRKAVFPLDTLTKDYQKVPHQKWKTPGPIDSTCHVPTCLLKSRILEHFFRKINLSRSSDGVVGTSATFWEHKYTLGIGRICLGIARVHPGTAFRKFILFSRYIEHEIYSPNEIFCHDLGRLWTFHKMENLISSVVITLKLATSRKWA